MTPAGDETAVSCANGAFNRQEDDMTIAAISRFIDRWRGVLRMILGIETEAFQPVRLRRRSATLRRRG
jgi:hypothetical protein